MFMKPCLLLDCYVEDDGAPRNFLPHFPSGPHAVIRAVKTGVPVSAADFAAIVVTGSAGSVVTPDQWVLDLCKLVQDALARDVPFFGVCFGHQVLARAAFGKQAVATQRPEVGWLEIEQLTPHPALAGMGGKFTTFVSHADHVLPTPGMQVFARTESCPAHGLAVPGSRAWSVQFHTEMGLEEASALVRYRAQKHPDLHLDVPAMLRRACDSARLCSRLFQNFFAMATPSRCRQTPKEPNRSMT